MSDLRKELGFEISQDDDGYFYENNKNWFRVMPYVGLLWAELEASRKREKAMRCCVNCQFRKYLKNEKPCDTCHNYSRYPNWQPSKEMKL